MHFKSRNDSLYLTIFGALIVFLIISSVYYIVNGNNFWATFISTVVYIAIAALLIWILIGTSYTLQSDFLRYKTGPIKGKIPIEAIRSVEVGKTMYVGMKPATARHGIIVHYNAYDELYISPESNETFINELRKLNAAIEIA